MKTWSLLSVVGLLVIAAVSGFGHSAASAQEPPQTVIAKAQKANFNDPNIKKSVLDNAHPRPASKARTLAKGNAARMCPVQIANNTGFYVEIYVNGTLEGTVGPWGSLSIDGSAVGVTLYARAPQTPLVWGPQRVPYCPFTWTLSLPGK